MGRIEYVEVDPNEGTRRHLTFVTECVPIPSGPGDTDDPLPPPRPSDISDVVREMLPLAETGINPHREGLTGLETYLWNEGSHQPISVTATAGPYSITATATPTSYRWETGDGTTYSSSTPGSADAPAATHVYERKGSYVLVSEVIWTGTYTWSFGDQSGGGDLGSVVRRAERPYQVVEVRSVLTG